jgi:raffinose synthase
MSSKDAGVSIHDGAVVCRGRTWVQQVGEAITVDADARGGALESRIDAAFLRVAAKHGASRHLFALGSIPELVRYTVCHRYEPYWMKPAAGTRLEAVPAETQFFLAELRGGDYLLLVPLVDDLFRFSLRGKRDGMLEIVAETGDAFHPGKGGLALYAAVGADPFELVGAGARSVAARLGTGRLRRDKPLPDMVDAFGWCTGDAFYQEVSS